MRNFQLYSEVKLVSANLELPIGSEGTIIDIPPKSKDAYVVEFVDDTGRTLAILDLTSSDIALSLG